NGAYSPTYVPALGRLFVPNYWTSELLEMSLATGNRTLLANDTSVGSGASIANATSMAYDATLGLLVTGGPSLLLSLPPSVAGTRTLISDMSSFTSDITLVNSLPLQRLTVDATRRVAYGFDYDAIYVVDLTNGDRVIVAK